MGEEAGVEISRGGEKTNSFLLFPLPFPELSVYERKQQKPCALTAGWFMRSFIQDWPGLQLPFVTESCLLDAALSVTFMQFRSLALFPNFNK